MEEKNTCKSCSHKWKSRSIYPYYCPRCLIKSWDYGDNMPCQICSRILFKPEVHHIDGNKKNNVRENRIFLCIDCHTAIHHGVGNKDGRSGKIRTYRKKGSYKRNEKVVSQIIELQKRL